MSIYLIRHAKAGRKSQFEGPDAQRPLDEAGRLQAKALATTIASFNPTCLLSSPYLRCMQTLQDLGEQTGQPVQPEARLAEDSDIGAFVGLLEVVADGAVLCSHGDMIPAAIRLLEKRGMNITTEPDSRKASVWVLDRDGEVFTSAAAWPPPTI